MNYGGPIDSSGCMATEGRALPRGLDIRDTMYKVQFTGKACVHQICEDWFSKDCQVCMKP